MRKRYAMWSCLGGAAAARAGDEMAGPALLLAGLAATGSAATASALLAGVTASAAVGGPVLGALLDRAARPGRLLAAALVLYAAGLAAILASLGAIPLPGTVLLAVATGLLAPALSGGWTAQLPRVVPPDALPRANALDAMTFNLSALLGPALAGTVAALFAPSAAVAAAAGLICLAVAGAWGLPGAGTARGRGGTPGTKASTSLLAELGAGVRMMARTPALARATTASVISCAGAGMLTACAPLLGERALGGAGEGAVLLSGLAVAALAANAALSRRPDLLTPDTVMWGSALVMAAALALAATCRPVPVIAAVLLAGAGEGPQLTALFAIRHREAPERLRGQVFTTGASLKITGFAAGAAVAGPLAARSLPGALLAAAALEVTAALTYAVRRRA
ncbi:MFS transporter [Streptomyces sp. NPDC052114]|uniref:MFS transporter n=1 Tax=unclassified Streptomyces TaxID=2593676 RepID=UPI00342E9C50